MYTCVQGLDATRTTGLLLSHTWHPCIACIACMQAHTTPPRDARPPRAQGDVKLWRASSQRVQRSQQALDCSVLARHVVGCCTPQR
jgi:hypothetical protein